MKPIVEKPSPNAVTDPVACEALQGEDFGCVSHYHPECEITLVLQGGTERLVGDNLTPLQPGDLVFLGPNVPHDYRNRPDPGMSTTRVEAIVVQFLPQLPGQDDYLNHSSMRPMQRLFQRAEQGLVVRGGTRLTATHIIRHMLSVHGMKRVILLLQLLDLLANSEDVQEICSSPALPSRSASTDRIGKVREHLEAHRAEPFYVADLAAMVGLGRSAFSRLFKSSTGRTLPQYVNELRIARASQLLTETDLTVSQIAYDCGFVSPAHFQRKFREHRKCTPLAYRCQITHSY